MPRYKRGLPPSTHLKDSAQQMHTWLKSCVEGHTKCQSLKPRSTFIPSRLIGIARNNGQEIRIRLCEAVHLKAPVRYATLSYCWGSYMPFKLTKSCLKSCLENIPLEDVSPVFRDAIEVTMSADIWYIWIDSLCRSDSRNG